jgi:membrane associated rhomboid family serine protease
MEDLETESETRLLWRRLFSDCRQSFKKMFLYVLVVSLPAAVMLILETYSAAVAKPASLAVSYGIYPLNPHSFPSVFLYWPFLHFGWGHLFGNLPFYLILGFLCCIRGVLDFVVIFVAATWVGGLGIWFTGGRGSVHGGASGVIMGFFGALLLRVVFEKSLVSLFWAAVVAVFYGSLFYIIIPSSQYSWQGHLFGFLGGVLGKNFFCFFFLVFDFLTFVF